MRAEQLLKEKEQELRQREASESFRDGREIEKDQIERLEDQKDTLTRKLGKAVNRAEGFKLDLINKNKECSKLYEKVEAFAATERAETNDLTSLQQLIRRSCGVDGVNNTQDENKYLRALVRGVRVSL